MRKKKGMKKDEREHQQQESIITEDYLERLRSRVSMKGFLIGNISKPERRQ